MIHFQFWILINVYNILSVFALWYFSFSVSFSHYANAKLKDEEKKICTMIHLFIILFLLLPLTLTSLQREEKWHERQKKTTKINPWKIAKNQSIKMKIYSFHLVRDQKKTNVLNDALIWHEKENSKKTINKKAIENSIISSRTTRSTKKICWMTNW